MIKCLKRDQKLVEDLIPTVVEEYKQFIKKELEIDKSVEITVDREFLEEREPEQTTSTSVHSHLDRISKTDETKKW